MVTNPLWYQILQNWQARTSISSTCEWVSGWVSDTDHNYYVEPGTAMLSCGNWFTHPWKWVSDRTRWLCVWVTLCAYNGSMRRMLPWELRHVWGGNRSESGIIILYSPSEQGYLVLVLFKHALVLLLLLYVWQRREESINHRYDSFWNCS